MKMQFIAQPAWPVLAWLAEACAGSRHGCRRTWGAGRNCGSMVHRSDLVRRFFRCRFRPDRSRVWLGGAHPRRAGDVRFRWLHRRPTGLGENVRAHAGLQFAPLPVAAAGASIDVTECGFQKLIGTIGLGIDRYTRELPTSAGPVRMAYFHNLSWDGAVRARKTGYHAGSENV